MILTTTDSINGKELETLGLVKGSTVQTVNAFRDIGAGLKGLVGGELPKYNEMMNNARALATNRDAWALQHVFSVKHLAGNHARQRIV